MSVRHVISYQEQIENVVNEYLNSTSTESTRLQIVVNKDLGIEIYNIESLFCDIDVVRGNIVVDNVRLFKHSSEDEISDSIKELLNRIEENFVAPKVCQTDEKDVSWENWYDYNKDNDMRIVSEELKKRKREDKYSFTNLLKEFGDFDD